MDKFMDIFSKVALSANVKSVLKDTYVQNVVVTRKTNKLDIFMKSENILNESCFNDFKIDLLKTMPYINEINININYEPDDNLEKTITKLWVNICDIVKIASPICYQIFKNSKFSLDNKNLNINVAMNSAYILNAKKINKLIKSYIKARLNLSLNVEFIDDILNDNTNKMKEIKKETLEKISKENININPNAQNIPNIPNRPTRMPNLKISQDIQGELISIQEALKSSEKIIIKGEIFLIDIIETRKGSYVIRADITDKTYSATFKIFTTPKKYKENYKEIIKKGNFVIIKGNVIFDGYMKETIIVAEEICIAEPPKPKVDTANEKRIELHVHTQMSKMDAISSVKDIIKRASDWGHKAIAITDHAVVQAFPEAMEVSKESGIKILYGVEAYIVDDLMSVVENSLNQNLLDEYVVFDIETTGLNRELNKIIEIGAIKIKNGEIIDEFQSFINPNEKLTNKIIELTNITDEMLVDAPSNMEILPKFFEFFGDSILVAHNASFDMGFIKKWAERNNKNIKNTTLDTLGLSRALFPEMSRHNLKALCKKVDVSLENHHRAIDDARATAKAFLKCVEILVAKHSIHNLDKINELASVNIDVKKLRPNHAIIFAKNQKGLKSLYELISKSNLEYFYREPRIPKSEILKFRNGLIIGSACEAGEFYQAVLNNASKKDIEKLIKFYDYLEIQPVANNKFLINSERFSNINSYDDIREINKKIIEYGKKYNKIVVATCDVHFLDKEDAYFRQIIMASKGFKDCDEQPPLYFKTTNEMLEEFSYLGEKTAYEVVVSNTNLINDMIDDILPIPNGTFTPKIEGSDIKLREITIKKAISIYGENLPKIVEDRLKKELNSIIKNGFAVLYIIAQKIVKNSNDNGYIVGSRGSVGSSFVATMADITEVNPLSPHYYCKFCKYSDFDSKIVLEYAGNSGWDLPDKTCPICSEKLSKDGHDIPFETFLGFEGDKEPDIDLNFSGEFQLQAHKYTEELFGKEFVFKAGTIGTLADKTAYGYVKNYINDRDIKINNAEINRLISGCVGIKRTTGQHPGGLMIVPNNKSIYDFCPVQRPADDQKSNVITTHFDYHSISGRILKLDLLGHDVPTILRMLKDFTKMDPLDTPMDSIETMSLFTSPNALGVTKDDINCKTGSLGLPEFGTPFVIQMLIDTNPNSFSDLVKISGLSHGTDVWFNNAQDLIKNGVATLKEVIPTRDDIMVYLILKGVPNKMAFTIMESVRKGKGLTKEFEECMLQKDVPKWYIESCKRIKYMFPKGHAVAYVTNAFRMGYFKINYPQAFYASLFSVKIDDFDYDTMCFGVEKVEIIIKEIQELGKIATAKEKSKLVVLEIVREMYKRGFEFISLNLYKSKGFKFDIIDNKILPPLCTVQGLGENATKTIIIERERKSFDTIEEFTNRCKISKTLVEVLKQNEVLKGMPDTNQLTLF